MTDSSRYSGSRSGAGEPRTRLSVVIPVKDDARQLEKCLAALVTQLSPIDELIVVDNASSDDSADVARRFGAVVVVEPTPGIAAASAAGYDRARGSLIGRMDADSVPRSDWVATVVRHFDSSPESAALTGPATFTDGPALLRGIGSFLYLGAYFVSVALALGHVPLFGSNFAFRRSEWIRVRNDVHRTDELVHDDMDLSFHIGPTHPIRFSSRLRVGISARPFSDGAGALRVRRAFHTIFLHWPDQLPWRRFTRRVLTQ